MYTSPYIGTPGGVPGQYPGAASSSASSDGSPTKTAPISNSTASTPPTASRKGGLSGLLKGLRRGLSTSSNGTSQQGEGSRPRSIRSRTLSVTGSDDSDNIPDARPTNPAALHMRSFSDDMSNGYNGMKSLNVPDDIRPDHSTIGYSDGLQQRQEGAAAEDPFYHPYDDAPEEKLVRRRPSPLPASSNRYSPRPSGEGTSPTDPWYTQTNPGQPRAAAPLENPFNTSIEINPATVVLTATSIPGSPTPSRASRVSMPSPWG
ncbi:hypothetical protein BC938DRAFT_480215 [Jimgerdemannia flammicorona]|uniref:Uncharacterized protein n=1 Tax=Jimgerdemannia flammicorona TaxID=994334 RepID=A0A433QJ71_9FUNG|nr:hypothetical protein BC938DRAFT_480215 [Jimgerdemannia flammicorona]